MDIIEGRYLEAALRIGRRIARDALWSGDECTWRVTRGERNRGAVAAKIESADATIYRGAAGIGLFLSELSAVTHDTIVARTAEGSANFVRRRVQSLAKTSFSTFAGRIGTAYAMARHGLATENETFLDAARGAVDALAGSEASDTMLDVIGGAAGAVPVLLKMSQMVDRPDWITMAERLGRRAILMAHREIDGWSWFSRGSRGTNIRNLTGLAHGASGYALGLLELAAATGNGEFLYGAEQAFAYERSVFDQARSVWPDFRRLDLADLISEPAGVEELQRMLRAGHSPDLLERPASVAWCHGAPGICFARTRAFELTGAREFIDEATIAATITATRLSPNVADFSLCHGAAGNLEALVTFDRVARTSQFRTLIEATADFGLDTWVRFDRPFPSGTVDGVADPSLMVGDAGIGLFYLRLAVPSVESVLMFTTDARVDRERVRAGREFAMADDIARRFGDGLVECERLCGKQAPIDIENSNGLRSTTAIIYEWLDAQRRTLPVHLREAVESALAIPIATREVEAETPNQIVEYLTELSRVTAVEINWRTARFSRGNWVRLVGASAIWQGKRAGDADGDTVWYLVFRHQSVTHVERLTPLGLLVLDRCEAGATLAEIIEYAAESVQASDEAVRRRIRDAIQAEIIREVKRGVIVPSIPPRESTSDVAETSAALMHDVTQHHTSDLSGPGAHEWENCPVARHA